MGIPNSINSKLNIITSKSYKESIKFIEEVSDFL